MEELLKELTEKHSDSVYSLCHVEPRTTYAPTKKCPNFRIACDIFIAPDVIKGNNAITDFGILALVRLPKVRITDKYIDPLPEVNTNHKE